MAPQVNPEIIAGAGQSFADTLAQAIADHFKLTLTDVSYQEGFGGLCGTFDLSNEDQQPPEAFSDLGLDPGGEWMVTPLH